MYSTYMHTCDTGSTYVYIHTYIHIETEGEIKAHTRHEPNLLRKLPIFLSSISQIGCLFFFLMLPIFIVLCDTCAFPLAADWPKSFVSQRVPSALDILVDPE